MTTTSGVVYGSLGNVTTPLYEPTQSGNTNMAPIGGLGGVIVTNVNAAFQINSMSDQIDATEQVIDTETDEALNKAIYGKILNKV